MRCEQLMKRAVVSLGPSDSVQAVARLMRSENVGFIPICDPESGKVLGTITDRDLALRVVGDGLGPKTRTGDIMTREVVACRPGDDLARAEELMATRRKSRIMVTDEQGVLVGVISLSDLAQRDGRHAVSTLQDVASREHRAA